MAPNAKLNYFGVRGLGECVRFLLAYGGIEFEDVRLVYEEWPQQKDTEYPYFYRCFEYPFGKLPVLEMEGRTMFQSAAICRFLAKRLGLAGAGEFEAQQIDALVDTIADLRTRKFQGQHGILGSCTADRCIASCMHSLEPEKTKKKETMFKETLPYYFTRLETLAKDNNGYFSNGKLSYADLVFAAIIDFLSMCMETDLLEGYPALRSLYEKVHSIPAIKEWVEKRPKTEY